MQTAVCVCVCPHNGVVGVDVRAVRNPRTLPELTVACRVCQTVTQCEETSEKINEGEERDPWAWRDRRVYDESYPPNFRAARCIAALTISAHRHRRTVHLGESETAYVQLNIPRAFPFPR